MNLLVSFWVNRAFRSSHAGSLLYI